jgi:hypothetical protein
MSDVARAAVLAAALAVASPDASMAQKRESPAEMRRIVAQAICLAEAYPDSAIANDGAAVVAVYQGTLGASVSVKDIEAVRGLAREAKPSAPTPVGNRNLAIAKCTLFADRADVTKLLGRK